MEHGLKVFWFGLALGGLLGALIQAKVSQKNDDIEPMGIGAATEIKS